MLILKSNGHFSCLVDITTHNYIDIANDSVFLQIVLFMFMLLILQLTWEKGVKTFSTGLTILMTVYTGKTRLRILQLWNTYCEDPYPRRSGRIQWWLRASSPEDSVVSLSLSLSLLLSPTLTSPSFSILARYLFSWVEGVPCCSHGVLNKKY